MKKKIIISIIVALLVITVGVASSFIYLKSFKSNTETVTDNSSNEIIDDTPTDEVENIEEIEDNEVQEEIVENESTTETESTNNSTSITTKGETKTTTSNSNNKSKSNESSSTTSSTPKENSTTSQNTTTTTTETTTTTKSCTPKKFTWTWVRADFDNFEDCKAMGDKYLKYYGYYCDSYQDDCKTTYYMLTLYELNGSDDLIDYHTVPIPE